MVLSLLIPLILLLVCSFSYQKAFAKEKTPDFFRLFMLSSKLDPRVKEWICTLYCIFVEFWRNICYFFTFYYYNLVNWLWNIKTSPLFVGGSRFSSVIRPWKSPEIWIEFCVLTHLCFDRKNPAKWLAFLFWHKDSNKFIRICMCFNKRNQSDQYLQVTYYIFPNKICFLTGKTGTENWFEFCVLTGKIK